MAFARLNPFGVAREEARHAEQMALLANINRDATKRPQPFTPEDFMPGERPKTAGRSAARQLRVNAALAGRLHKAKAD